LGKTRVSKLHPNGNLAQSSKKGWGEIKATDQGERGGFPKKKEKAKHNRGALMAKKKGNLP